MMNLVTGGTGFLGSHLIEALFNRRQRVRALVRPTSDSRQLNKMGIELVIGDLSDISSLAKAVDGVTRVYHCAALASDWGSWESFKKHNVTGVKNLLNASSEGQVSRFVHISSTDVYGHPGRPVDEAAQFRFRGWPYGDTKIAAEQAVWEHNRTFGLPVTVIRPVNIYGPRSPSFVVEIADLLQKKSMVLLKGRALPAGLTYVSNVVDLILLASESSAAIGQVYNACDGSDVSWPEYVGRLSEILRVPLPRLKLPYRFAYFAGWLYERVYGLLGIKSRPLITRMVAEVFGSNQGFSIAKARRQLGYYPRVGFEEGMSCVAKWLQEEHSPKRP